MDIVPIAVIIAVLILILGLTSGPKWVVSFLLRIPQKRGNDITASVQFKDIEAEDHNKAIKKANEVLALEQKEQKKRKAKGEFVKGDISDAQVIKVHMVRKQHRSEDKED